MHDFIKQLGIKQTNEGVSTGVNWLGSTGELITSSSPVDGKTIASVTSADKATYEAVIAKAQTASNTLELSPQDVMATLNRFSAETIADCIHSSLTAGTRFNMYSSGGGMHNPVMMGHLQNLLPNATLYSSEVLGINPDAKEAVLFAILANECIAGGNVQFSKQLKGIPSVTMGKISFPW